MKRRLVMMAAVAAGMMAGSAVQADQREPHAPGRQVPRLQSGDRVVFCGDSITCLGHHNAFGFRHQITNALAHVTPEKAVRCVNLGFCGNGVKNNWLGIERDSRTRTVQANAHSRAYPEESVSATFSNRVDVLVLCLGMNDILCPYFTDTPESFADWRKCYAELVRNLKARVHPRVTVLGTVPPLTNDPQGPKNVFSSRMDDEIRRIAADEGALVVDYKAALFRALGRIRRISPDYQDAPDFVHPRELGNIAMAAELCRTLGETAAADFLEAHFKARLAELVKPADKSISYRIFPLGLEDPDARERSYRIEWTRLADGRSGSTVVKTVPDRAVNAVTVEGERIDLPAPWRVSAPFTGEKSPSEIAQWRLTSGTFDYLGGVDSGSVDYMQAWFGGTADSFYACRGVYSERDRDLPYEFRTAAFSNTYDFRVELNGALVSTNALPRGKTVAPGGVLRLKRGWNDLVIRCGHRQWQRQFSFRLLPPADDDLSDIRYSWDAKPGAPRPAPVGDFHADARQGGASFRWELNGTGETKTFVPKGIPPEGAYTVRFRAALMNAANGGKIAIVADGVRFRCSGDGFTLDDAGENHVIPGQLDDRNFDFSLRNRCYHDVLFVCLPDRVVLFGDGKEKRPVLKARGAPRGFSFASVGADVDVTGFEAAAGDMRGTWSSRNMAINGGFEELNGGFPPYWTTYNFGFGSADEIADLKTVRTRYRIDDTVAWEGRNSMLLDGTWIPFWECFMTRPKDEDYVFSVYVRTDRPGTKLKLMADSWYNTFATKVVTVDDAGWTRFELPFHSKFSSFRCGVRLEGTKGRAWIDGAQVEKGTAATAYVTHPVPRGGVPPNPPKVMDHYYATLAGARQPSGKPPRMARVDPKRNSFRFGDREYFMYGFTGFTPDTRPVTKKALDRLQEWGMNMHLAHGSLPKDPAKLRAALDECEKRGIKTSFAIRYDKKSGKLDEEGLAAVEAVADHPALLSIDLFDECYGQVTPEKRLAVADEVRRQTGNRIPISFNEFDLGVINHMDFSAADIASGDFYVPGLQEISAQYYVLKQLRDDNPDQVVSYYPMASGHFSVWPRDATMDETVAQAYIGYVLEVFNIKWWQAVPTTETALEGIIRAKRERDLIDPSAFLDGTPADVTCESRNDAVKFTARRMKSGVTRVIAVNVENRPNAAKWMLPSAPKAAKALVGKGPDKVSGATIEDAFGPLERRVYDLVFEP